MNNAAQKPDSSDSKKKPGSEPFGIVLLNLLRRISHRVFRPGRMRFFLKVIAPTPNDRILDVGGYPDFWRNQPELRDITILNTHPMPGTYPERFKIVLGNGLDLPYSAKEFEIVHSNSVIEHLYDFASQERFAAELRRVGRKLWVQTPARHFLIEPHYIDCVCHWLPKRAQRRLLRFFTPWGWIVRPNQAVVDQMVNEIRLLTLAEMKTLFPDCQIHREKVLGWTKSYIAIRE